MKEIIGMQSHLTQLMTILLATLLAAICGNGHAQTPQNSASRDDLVQTISALDGAVFEAYNRCELEKFGGYFISEVEFYHDDGGMTDTREKMVANTKKYICGKVRRELISGSLEVFPIKDFGALATGEHRFCEISTNRCEGIAKFALVWRREQLAGKDAWQITRVLSFGHRAATAGELASPKAAQNGRTALDRKKIQKLMAENNIPAIGIGIIRDGKLAEIEVIGELKKNVAAPQNAIFNVASLTKPVVSLLALRLVSQGDWSLDEPLAQYWVDPDVAGDPRHLKLTTRHVLSHQTGFVNWRWLHASKKLAFDVEPGTKFQYSGEGFEYLRRALEHKFKMPLEQLADAVVLKPLGMGDTRLVWDIGMDAARFAVEHDAKGGAYPTDKRMKANAADDLLTTVSDYAKFGISVMNGAGLNADVFKEMITPQAKMKRNASMGLGWELQTDLSQAGGAAEAEYALIHSGSDKGVRTLIVLLPVSKQGLIIFTNGDNGAKLYEKLIVDSLDRGKEIWARSSG